MRDGTGACVLCTGAVRRRRALTRHSGVGVEGCWLEGSAGI